MLYSDRNLMSILGQFISTKPNILHSINPQADIDITEVKELTYGENIPLMENVECKYVQERLIDKIIKSANYAIEHSSKGGGYIFISSI